MSIKRNGALSLLTAALLAACGGGGDDAPPARGTIITAQLAAQVAMATIDAGTAASGAQALTGLAQCDVDIRYVYYVTRDPAGQPATASTAVMVPSGTGANCSGERPVLLHAHGTTTAKSYNIADVAHNSEGALLMSMYAAQGFIVVAPNYLGYDRSSLSYHPYILAEANAVDMVDGLRAAKAHLAAASAVKPSAKLLVTGYSEGGYVAMATHKVIERDHAGEFTVTASGPMSGPYNWLKTVDVAYGAGPVPAGAVLFTPLILTGYQKTYGDIYASVNEVYQSPYAATAETLFPTDTAVSDLMAQGKLPADPTLTMIWGTGGLLTDSFRTAYASSRLRKRIEENSLLGWTPKRPMALCGGAEDPTIFYFNATDAQADFAARGAQVPAFNLESRSTLPSGALGDALYAGFQARKTAAGTNATAQYHGGLVPPFCTALMRGFFQQTLASGL
ncbi:prolyl oligopeptidase family serine peptidase [Ideonella sp. DXS22W]|uniref:Prolyl oligopeptidase family serine peptidase n=1 Tax=Pseudaquabacterium inlustre TaxID=2984192 RepID=A0ABU9CHY0_9BURK